jgi:hypothetical protein
MTPSSQTESEWEEGGQTAQSARVQISHELNQLFRRFRQYEKEADWVRLVMEGAANYARQAALFAVQGETLKVRGLLNVNLTQDLTFEAKTTAAFNAVLRSKEAVTALRSNGEVGAALASPGKLAYLFPITNGPRVAAILFASAEDSEVDPLELVSNMASSALEKHGNTGTHAQITPTPAAAQPLSPSRRLPIYTEFPADQRALHSEAVRFARVTVAELQLAKPAACRTAREQGDLYVVLSKEIDKARETFRRQFMIVPSMTDYLHKELVESILQGDTTKLGADYPGELA